MAHEIGMVDWQPKMVNWVRTRLGDAAMASHERGMRFGEESFELLQAIGLTKKELVKLMNHVFSKEPGRVGQEIGGVVTTLLVLAQSQDVDMNIAALMEIDRIHALPPEKFQKRQELNASLGIGVPPACPDGGKAQDGVEYSTPLLNSAGTECVRCHQPLDQHLAVLCGGDDGTVVRTEGGNGYIPVRPTVNMDALRDICAGKIPPVPKEYESAVASLSKHPDKLRELLTVVGIDPAAHEVDLCWNKQYNTDTGQTGACGRPKGHKGNCGDWEIVG